MQVPTPQQFQPYLEASLKEAISYLQQVSPSLADTLAAQINGVCDDVTKTLQERGEQYGEDLLFLTGENGILTMAVWKSLRMLWSQHQQLPYESRKDGWRDLAGYAILCMAMQDYMDQWSKELDNLVAPPDFVKLTYSSLDEADSSN